MSRFSRFSLAASGIVSGFAAGVLVDRHFDKLAVDGADVTAAASDQLLSGKPVPVPLRPGSSRSADVTGVSAGVQDDCFQSAVKSCRELALRTKEEMGIPGLSIAVSVHGQTVWAEGFGYADVENVVHCSPKTVMRIASISKPLTMTALAKLWEEGKVDLDLPVQHYVPAFPEKTYEGEPVEITTRMLVSHLSGIRHWKGGEEREPKQEKATVPEFYLNTHFKSVEDALSVFLQDDLLHKPGTKYLYSSPAWTLISAVMEKAAGASYREVMMSLFYQLGLKNTTLDENERITPNRARYYIRNKNGRLTNSPSVDNSCKWAGGGLQSTVLDLVKFGDAMLYCYQGGPSGFLKKDTIDALWTIAPNTIQPSKGFFIASGYGMGWCVTPAVNKHGGVEPQSFTASHTGGAVGASSVLLIVPHRTAMSESAPKGISVAIIVNMQQVGLSRLAYEIAEHFSQITTFKTVSANNLSLGGTH